MNDPILKVQNLSKRYRIGAITDQQDTFIGSIVSSIKNPLKNFQSLKKLTTFKNSISDDDFLGFKRYKF